MSAHTTILAPLPQVPRAGAVLPWRALLAVALTLLACALSTQGGVLAWSAALGGALACGFLAWPAPRASAEQTEAPTGEASHSTDLTRVVVPAWQSQIELARQQADQNTSQLMESFADLSVKLDAAVGSASQLTPDDSRDFIETVLAENAAHVAILSAPVREAIQTKRDAQTQILTFNQWLGDLRKLSQDVQALARTTNLVAVNAAIEANRAGTAGRSFSAVADEVRTLAAQSSQAGERIAGQLQRMEEAMASLHSRVTVELDTDEAALLAANNAARKVVTQLLSSAAHMADSSRHLRDASRGVQTQIDALMVGLQHQDRHSQILNSITQDMTRFGAWAKSGQASSAAHAADWLEALERSYTTTEQRNQHHGTATVSQSSGVDFF